MSMMTEEQMTQAVELFAQGVPRAHIAQMHIDEPTEAIEDSISKIGEQPTKEKIANQLRNADPTSSKFAETKYLTHYNNHVAALRKAMTARYDQLLAGEIRNSQLVAQQITGLIEEVRDNLNSAEEPEPTGNGEWNNTIRTLTALLKAQSEHNTRVETLIYKFAVGMPVE